MTNIQDLLKTETKIDLNSQQTAYIPESVASQVYVPSVANNSLDILGINADENSMPLYSQGKDYLQPNIYQQPQSCIAFSQSHLGICITDSEEGYLKKTTAFDPDRYPLTNAALDHSIYAQRVQLHDHGSLLTTSLKNAQYIKTSCLAEPTDLIGRYSGISLSTERSEMKGLFADDDGVYFASQVKSYPWLPESNAFTVQSTTHGVALFDDSSFGIGIAEHDNQYLLAPKAHTEYSGIAVSGAIVDNDALGVSSYSNAISPLSYAGLTVQEHKFSFNLYDSLLIQDTISVDLVGDRYFAIEMRLERVEDSVDSLQEVTAVMRGEWQQAEGMLQDVLDYIAKKEIPIPSSRKITYHEGAKELNINGVSVPLRGDSLQELICGLLLKSKQAMKKVWYADELADNLGSYDEDASGWGRKAYFTARHLNDKISKITGLQHFFVYTTQTIKVNPLYIS